MPVISSYAKPIVFTIPMLVLNSLRLDRICIQALTLKSPVLSPYHRIMEDWIGYYITFRYLKFQRVSLNSPLWDMTWSNLC